MKTMIWIWSNSYDISLDSPPNYTVETATTDISQMDNTQWYLDHHHNRACFRGWYSMLKQTTIVLTWGPWFGRWLVRSSSAFKYTIELRGVMPMWSINHSQAWQHTLEYNWSAIYNKYCIPRPPGTLPNTSQVQVHIVPGQEKRGLTTRNLRCFKQSPWCLVRFGFS